ncbi:MAG: UDP-N-acetylmuramoyl-L-alanine--D-glutamate ligase [Thermoanaerobaculia bacterium]
MPWSSDAWSRVAVYGLGISGRAVARFLRRRGVEVVAFDGRRLALEELGELASDAGVELRLGAEPTELPEGIDGVVVSPGVPSDRPLLAAARAAGLPVIAEVELAFPFLDGEVAAITGSNGKSTTTALAGAMLRAAGGTVEICGNIGEALTACVAGEPGFRPPGVRPPGRTFVVELSSFQLEAVDRFHPRVAALLNISADHLDRHRGLDGYVAAKAAIFRRQQPSDVAVLNADDPRVRALEVVARRRFFDSSGTVEDGCHVDGDTVVEVAPGAAPAVLFRTGDVPLPGLHNLENAMAAALVARACGAGPEAIAAALGSFEGLPHRLELVRERAGVRWYDDSKGTNLAATVRSLEGFADRSVHVILGGQFKGGDLGELRARVERKACRAYLIGESADRFAAALTGAVAMEPSGILERAVTSAADNAGAGEVVLLSPACASFDQFDNFAQRGRVFQRLVRALDDTGGGDGAQARL